MKKLSPEKIATLIALAVALGYVALMFHLFHRVLTPGFSMQAGFSLVENTTYSMAVLLFMRLRRRLRHFLTAKRFAK